VRTGVAIVCLAAAALVGGARSALAADEDDANRSTELFKAGLAAGKSGDYAQAEAAFRGSYALRPSAATLRNLALAEMKLGKMVEALGHLRLAMSAGPWTAEQRRVVQANFDDAYAATGHLAIRTTDGARIAIDGVPLARSAPLDAVVDVAGGPRRLEARLGSRAAHAEVDAEPGRVLDVSLYLPPEPAPPDPTQTLPASGSVQPSSETSSERVASSSWWTAPHALAVGLGATAAAGAGLGAYFEAASQTAASDASFLRSSLGGGACTAATASAQCGALRDKIASIHQDETLAGVSFGVGAAAAIGLVVVLVVARPRDAVRTGALRLAPTVGPGAAGVAGSF
jgi:hypothetical protein